MNPFEVKTINEEEKEIISLGSRVEQLERRMIEYKKLEENYKQAKEELRQKMLAKDIKTWTLTNGTKLTAMADVEPKEKKVKAFAVAKLKDEMPDIYEKYTFINTEWTNGRKGSLRVTLPKEA